MNKAIKEIKYEMALLDVEPFAYNVSALLATALCFLLHANSIFVIALCSAMGFSLFTSVATLLRSKLNKYCFWHRVPIYNMIMISVFDIFVAFNMELLSDVKYPILYTLFTTWCSLFLFSSVIFLRKRIKKLHRRCTSCQS